MTGAPITGGQRGWAVVTGAARNIGLAIAQRLASDGFAIAAWDVDPVALRRTADEMRQAGAVVRTAVCDIREPLQIADAIAVLPGRIAVLVNNAAAWQPSTPLIGLATDQWRSDLEMLLTGPQQVTAQVAATMTAGDAIVNLCSVHALAASPNWGTYDVAKAALAQWTRVLAAELGPRGIRVNAVSPGIIASTDDEATYAREPGLHRLHAEVAMLRRVGRPIDVAGAVSFLVSPNAGFVTAQNLVVDGGMTAQLPLTTAEIATRTPSTATRNDGPHGKR